MLVKEIYYGSNGGQTRSLFTKLKKQHGQIGEVAILLFKAQKASMRAKESFGKYRRYAYERKGVAISQLCRSLEKQSDIVWGWREDIDEPYAKWVLYLDLPTGQSSFHNTYRVGNNEYWTPWNGGGNSSIDNIIDWLDLLMKDISDGTTEMKESEVSGFDEKVSDMCLIGVRDY